MKKNPTVLIFSTVWPEPQSSAAGVRQLQWVRVFKRMGMKVVLSSSSKLKEPGEWGYRDWSKDSVELLPLPMNRSEVVEQIKILNPEIVMFDRFIVEEQFGPMVQAAVPSALLLLETQDLHCLRRAREKMRAEDWSNMPAIDFSNDETAIREIASIERVDYSFVISSFEEALLEKQFKIGHEKQKWIPMVLTVASEKTPKSFEPRTDFVWIGNFRHAPNADGLRWFLKSMWPEIQKRLPEAKLNIYGAYPSKEFSGSHFKGSPEHLSTVFESARVNLAPLRFGAGVKGKILEGFQFGVPVVTTPIGAEGILPEGETRFPGMISKSENEFINACVAMHSDASLWKKNHEQARALMTGIYDSKRIENEMEEVMANLVAKKARGEFPRFMSKILRHELSNSHKYFSKWIELKEKIQSTQM